ncbi:endosome-associated trafficking regulator 1 [Holotrichia oblita]|uniref:Endosome-associated trafficking regulator 1 n=1 Tax=Holotrichia oblita TaxID=644536 RepID=A0ACB9TYX0_HOLOL|nr:endosome-associated trafficking regulator 1 [Holotrichia oblita]
MADSDGGPYENSANPRQTVSGEDSETDEPMKLDIGVDLSRNFERTTALNDFNGASGSNVTDTPKKEDNPFSFKHFLRSDSNSYHSQGARPKVYCDGRPVSSISDLDLHNPSDKQNRIVPEFSSALPDFVQDHLVIEQCYLNKDNLNRKYGDLNNLPDFTTPSRINRLDLNTSRGERRTNQSKSIPPIPLDLPVRPQAEFPLDLPVSELQAVGTRSCPPSAEVAVSKSLPDFLADGAVRTKNENVLPGQSPERERDVDRLRQELELCRRQLLEQTRRADLLQRELEIARNKEHEYTQNLGKALEQVEENLDKSNKRVLAGESTILRLRQEVKSLTAEVNCLKCENQELRGEEGAAGGGPTYRFPSQRQTQRLASDLRSAASTAEHSLRQLLTGVDNLRIMASSLENMHRIEENSESDFDFDDTAGPAL